MNVDEYLKRINCSGLKKPCLENLKTLQINSLRSITFENLDMHLGKHMKFDLFNAYKKVMSGVRGGHCLELSGLFGWLLNELNYEFYFTTANTFLPNGQKYARLSTHVLIIVRLNDKNYYVDLVSLLMVYEPIEVEIEKPVKQKFGAFKFILDENGFFLLQRTSNKDFSLNIKPNWISLVRFKLKPESLECFSIINEIVQNPCNTILANKVLCGLQTETSIRILVGWKFSEINFQDDEVTRSDENLDNIEKMKEILHSKFGLTIGESFNPRDDTVPPDAHI